jgi:hypothetical protein
MRQLAKILLFFSLIFFSFAASTAVKADELPWTLLFFQCEGPECEQITHITYVSAADCQTGVRRISLGLDRPLLLICTQMP